MQNYNFGAKPKGGSPFYFFCRSVVISFISFIFLSFIFLSFIFLSFIFYRISVIIPLTCLPFSLSCLSGRGKPLSANCAGACMWL
jgi:hypothetical protein